MTMQRIGKRSPWTIAVFVCLVVGVLGLPVSCLADEDLFVGNFSSPGEGVLEYNATTGAFIGQFGPNIGFPLGAAFGPDGNFYVTDSNTDTVLQLNGTTGATLNSTFASAGDAAGLAFGPTGNLFVVSSSAPGQINVFNGMTGKLLTTVNAGGILMDPEGMTLGPNGNLYVAGGDGDNVLEFDGKTGAFIKTVVTNSACPTTTPNCLMSVRGVAFGPDGNLYITSFDTDIIWQYNVGTGKLTDFAGATGACSALFLPRDPTFGPNGNLFVTSYGSGDIFEYNGTTGACVSDFVPAGTGNLAAPTFLLFGEGSSSGGGGSSTVPEPSSFALLACAIAGLAAFKRRNFRGSITAV